MSDKRYASSMHRNLESAERLSTPLVASGEDLDLTAEAEDLEHAQDISWAEWNSNPLPDMDDAPHEYARIPMGLAVKNLEPDVFVRSRDVVRSNTYDTWDTWDDFNPRSGEESSRARGCHSASLAKDQTGSASKEIRTRRLTPAGRRCYGSSIGKVVAICAIAFVGLAFMQFRCALPRSE